MRREHRGSTTGPLQGGGTPCGTPTRYLAHAKLSKDCNKFPLICFPHTRFQFLWWIVVCCFFFAYDFIPHNSFIAYLPNIILPAPPGTTGCQRTAQVMQVIFNSIALFFSCHLQSHVICLRRVILAAAIWFIIAHCTPRIALFCYPRKLVVDNFTSFEGWVARRTPGLAPDFFYPWRWSAHDLSRLDALQTSGI